MTEQSEKVSVVLRRDQAECALGALEYVIARFDEITSGASLPSHKFAARLAKSRCNDVATIIKQALDE